MTTILNIRRVKPRPNAISAGTGPETKLARVNKLSRRQRKLRKTPRYGRISNKVTSIDLRKLAIEKQAAVFGR